MRDINKIIIHATDTPTYMDVTVAMIDRWHKAKGWDEIGYHFLIDRWGVTHNGRPVEKVGAHTKGHNHDSIGIAMAGGEDGKFDFNCRQMSELHHLALELAQRFDIKSIHGHNEFSDKECPCFDVQAYFSRF